MAIRNDLAVLLAERRLKARQVSDDTGIARSTLYTIVNNRNKAISMKVIDTLCQYLHVTPAEFFVYDPHPTSSDWYYKYYKTGR